MENQQPIKQKDLQYFKDEVAREAGYKDFASIILSLKVGALYHAAERYGEYVKKLLNDREQQAKHAGFIEGAKAMDAKIRNESFGLGTGFVSLPQSPYEPREKGGEDEH